MVFCGRAGPILARKEKIPLNYLVTTKNSDFIIKKKKKTVGIHRHFITYF